MKSNTVVNVVLVVVGFLVAFGLGYLIIGSSGEAEEVVQPVEEVEEQEEVDVEDLASQIPDEAQAFSRNGCLSCHSVESMDVIGGDIGPDLSRIFPEIKGKYGKELEDFLQEPTAAVMSTVIASDPLEDDDRAEIVEFLKLASEQKASSENSSDDEEKEEAEDEDED